MQRRFNWNVLLRSSRYCIDRPDMLFLCWSVCRACGLARQVIFDTRICVDCQSACNEFKSTSQLYYPGLTFDQWDDRAEALAQLLESYIPDVLYQNDYLFDGEGYSFINYDGEGNPDLGPFTRTFMAD